MKFQYTVDPAAKIPVMLLNKHIGVDPVDGQGINGADFQAELLALDAMGKESIQIWINSPGGVILDAYGIYNAIIKSKTKVDTFAVGMAASSAALIFQAGRNRIISDYGFLMYHNPSTTGDQKVLDVFKASIVTMVASRSGLPAETISKMMDRETWINPDEALACGLADKIELSADNNKKRLSTTNEVIVAGNIEINNKIKTKTGKMLKVTNKLGLTDDASEASILQAVNSIVDENTSLKADKAAYLTEDKVTKKAVAAAKQAYDDLSAAFEKQKNDFDDSEDKVKNLEKKMSDDEEKATDDKAKNLITGFIETGRLKNTPENVATWVKLAKNDFAGTKAIIEELPINAKADKIRVVNEAPIALGSSIGRAEAELRNKLKI